MTLPHGFQMQKDKQFPIKASKLFLVTAIVVSTLGVTACDLTKNVLKPDREGSMEMQDYKDALAPRIPQAVDPADANKVKIPELKPYIASGGAGMKSMPLVSLSVNQSIPLRDVLFELAQQANYDLELDPNIRGAIIFTARNRPFDQVVERISDIAGLRHSFEGDVLRVEVDNPYNKTYKIDYLSYVRKTSGGIRNAVNVVSGEGNDTGSTFEASSESEINFWGELEANLTQILGGPSTMALKTDIDPQISVAEQNPDVQAVTADGQPAQAPQAVLNVSSLPVDSQSSSGNTDASDNPQTFTINRQAGLINVFGTDKTHKEVLATNCRA